MWTVVLVLYLIDVCNVSEEADEEEEIRLVDGFSGFGLKTLQMSDTKF